MNKSNLILTGIFMMVFFSSKNSYGSDLKTTIPKLENTHLSDDCSEKSSLKNQYHLVQSKNDIEQPTAYTENEDNTIRIGSIDVVVDPIFDENNPKENNWLYRLANRLHIPTRKHVIQDDLLFNTNDVFDLRLLQASERVLNSRRYLGESTVAVSDACNNTVDVKVKARDVWTLKPQFNFSHSGGNSKSSVGLADANFFGSGKSVLIKHVSDLEKTGNVYQYLDPNIGNYNSRLFLNYSDNDDGQQTQASLERPFIDFGTSWSAGLGFNTFEQNETLYNAGEDAQKFGHDGEINSIFFGRKLRTHYDSDGLEQVSRMIIGFNQSSDDFFYNLDSDEILPNDNDPLPAARSFSTLWFEYQTLNDGFIQTSNIQQFNRSEYLNLGNVNRIRLGYSPTSLELENEKDQPAYLLEFENSYGIKRWKNQLLMSHVHFNGYYTDDGLLNTILSGDLSYHWQNIDRGQLYINLQGNKGFNLYKDQPIVLGGDNGLRGYPTSYQAGDRSTLFTIEQRFFGTKEWLSLFHAGSAVFYDVGRAWGETSIPQTETTWLKEVGVGLRISGTRTGNHEEGAHTILHLDLVAPLDGGEDLSTFQWRVKAESHF